MAFSIDISADPMSAADLELHRAKRSTQNHIRVAGILVLAAIFSVVSALFPAHWVALLLVELLGVIGLSALNPYRGVSFAAIIDEDYVDLHDISDHHKVKQYISQVNVQGRLLTKAELIALLQYANIVDDIMEIYEAKMAVLSLGTGS